MFEFRLIDIPFHEDMRKEALEGRKFCTSRNKCYGDPGDEFYIGNTLFILTGIRRFPLERVAKELYKEEGFDSPESFIDLWNKLHPRKKFDPTQEVYVHFFRRA